MLLEYRGPSWPREETGITGSSSRLSGGGDIWAEPWSSMGLNSKMWAWRSTWEAGEWVWAGNRAASMLCAPESEFLSKFLPRCLICPTLSPKRRKGVWHWGHEEQWTQGARRRKQSTELKKLWAFVPEMDLRYIGRIQSEKLKRNHL